MDTKNNQALAALKTEMQTQDEAAALRAEIEALKAQNAELKAKQPVAKTQGGIKISPKKAVAVYGFGRWPVTLYLSQWEYLFSQIDNIRAFIEQHRSKLAVKPGESETEEQVKVS